eukprot:COSAG02_NODE_43932_length_370_cov_0.937269_1_plen_41_part_10
MQRKVSWRSWLNTLEPNGDNALTLMHALIPLARLLTMASVV